jgi:hypothetical protein
MSDVREGSGSRRKTQPLSESLQQRLNMYTLAASAAGVGVLALAQPAEARIVYTKANISIPENAGLIELDLNHDGVNDFQFLNRYKNPSQRSSHTSRLYVGPAQTLNRAIRIASQNKIWAAALPKGYRVDFKDAFQPGHNQILLAEAGWESFSSGTYGPWVNKQAMYLGLEFFIKGTVHYGWARLNVSVKSGDCKNICATITGYAYETIADKGIVAGQTKGEDEATAETRPRNAEPPASTLGRLAQGAQGLEAWRRSGPQ